MVGYQLQDWSLLSFCTRIGVELAAAYPLGAMTKLVLESGEMVTVG